MILEFPMDTSRMTHRVAVFGALTLLAASAAAHHGPHAEPLYDTGQVTEFEGEVTDVFWRNPHARFRVRITAGPQTGEIWEIETNPPGPLSRTGFTPDLLPIGSQVKVAGVVSRRRPNYLGLYNLLLPNGYEFADMARPKPLRFAEERLPLDFDSSQQASAESLGQEPEGIFRVWQRERAGLRRFDESELTEAAKAAKPDFDAWLYLENPDCIQPGMPTGMQVPTPIQFVDEGDTIVLLQSEYDLVRTIHMNSDVDPETQPATPLGYSVGRWEDDTLVITTTRIDWPLHDRAGVPQSADAMHIERFTPSADGRTMTSELISTDPLYLIGSPVRTGTYSWLPGREIEPYECTRWEGEAEAA